MSDVSIIINSYVTYFRSLSRKLLLTIFFMPCSAFLKYISMPSFSNTWYGIYLIIMIINVFFHVLSFVFRNNLFTNKQNSPSQKFWMASGCTWIVLQHNARCLVWHWCGFFFLFNSFSISIINYILLLTILYF